MRKYAGMIAVAIAFSLTFWPYCQMVDDSELDWCNKLSHRVVQLVHTHDGHRASEGHSPHSRLCCHKTSLIVPTLAHESPKLEEARLAYLVAEAPRLPLPPAPFRAQTVPPG